MTDLQITRAIEQSATEVLETMFFIGAVPADAPPAEAISIEIAFDGDPAGRFFLLISPSAAGSIAANFLGEEPAAISPPRVAEVACELANMICGAVLSRLESTAIFSLSPPQVLCNASLVTPAARPCPHGEVCLDTGDGILSLHIETEIPTCQPAAKSAF